MSKRSSKHTGKRKADSYIGYPAKKSRYAAAHPRRSLYSRLPLEGFGKSQLVRMRYATNFTLDPATLGTANHVFRANGCFDPDSTGIGHQPRGFDQLMANFDHYTVIQSKITVTAASNTTVNLSPMLWDVFVQDQVGSHCTYDYDMLESKHGTGKVKLSGVVQNYNGQSSSITKHFNTGKFFGLPSSNVPGNLRFTATKTADPSEQAFFVVYGASVTGNDPSIQSFYAVIEYICQLTEPTDIGSS